MSGRSRARKRAAQLSADQLEAEGYAEQDQTAKHHSTTPEVQVGAIPPKTSGQTLLVHP